MISVVSGIILIRFVVKIINVSSNNVVLILDKCEWLLELILIIDWLIIV